MSDDPVTPRWTRERPIEPGWYWWHNEPFNKAEMCRLCYPLNRGFDGRTLVAKFTDGSNVKVKELPGLWQGPILPSEEGAKRQEGA
jgi:hypothetical protein